MYIIKNFKPSKFLLLAISLAIPIGMSLLGSLAVGKNSLSLYGMLLKPGISPPMIVLRGIWILLCIFMGVSFYKIVVDIKDKYDLKSAIQPYFILLVLEFSWNIIFFGKQNRLAGIFIVLGMLFFTYLTYIRFKSVRKTSGYLLIPVFIWLIYLLILSAVVWYMNLNPVSGTFNIFT